MSIPKWRISRGFSAGAAFVFALILAATALTIQAVSPISVSQSTQTAAIAQVAAGEATAPAPTKPCNRPGFDILFNNPKDGSVPQEFYWPVCPTDGQMTHSASINKYGWWSVGVYIKNTSDTVPPKGFNFNWGNGDAWGGADGVPGDARCTWQNNGADNQVYIPAKGKTWECDVLHCEYTTAGVSGGLFKSSGDVAYTVPHDAITACKDLGRKNSAPTPPTTPKPTPTATSEPTPVTSEDCDLKADPTDKAVCKLIANQRLPETSTLDDVLQEHKDNKEWYAEYCAGKDADTEVDGVSCATVRKDIADNEEALKKIAADQEENTKTSCDGKSGLDLVDCQKAKERATENMDKINTALENETAGPGTESPTRPPCTDNNDPTTDCEPTLRVNNCEKGTFYSMRDKECQSCNDPGDNACKCPAGQVYDIDNNKCTGGDGTKPQTCSATKPCPSGQSCVAGQCKSGAATPDGKPYSQPYARPDNSARGQGGTQQPGSFGNPGLGTSNTPQSPFGGACVQRYVCTGNTLYYQAPTGYGQGAQCMTQPVQQCPYGCQQQYGASGQPGQQQGGLMSTMAQIMPIIGSMFGGSNTSAVNNLPSACATQPQNQNGTGNDGQPCQQPPQQQPDPSQCTSGQWKQTTQQNGCPIGWQCVPNGGGSGTPTAQLSCQPKLADVGMPISFSFSCGNSNGSAGTGFDTGGALSGNATSPAPTPPEGQNTATYTLTCIKEGVTASAQCQVQLGKPGIVLVTNPKSVKGGETSLIGWITSGMQSCVVSSPDQSDFTARNANNTNVNGAATTSPIVMTSRFQLDCTTLGGGSKQSTTTVTISQ